MIANTLGPDDFRKGTDEYFRRYDGQAVTVEDFYQPLASLMTKSRTLSTGIVSQVRQWYRALKLMIVQRRH
ncbi:hypothetical protein PKHYL_17390 [Psychrobacter sp. KH172YL61]|nr:hypothetical protein PKHYL_17390 [Psychrobacter sp. KH172YL61]